MPGRFVYSVELGLSLLQCPPKVALDIFPPQNLGQGNQAGFADDEDEKTFLHPGLWES